MNRRIGFQVFEHDRLQVGKVYATVEGGEARFEAAHLERLLRFNDLHEGRFLSAGHHSVRFGKYVGILQTGGLTIEILPKADRGTKATDRQRWQRALLEMIRIARGLRLQRIDEVAQRLRHDSLLELFIALFLDAVDSLVHEGLIRRYREIEENLGTFRGRLVVARHLRDNLVHAERFFVAHEVYDHTHLINQILTEALQVLSRLPLQGTLSARVKGVLACFPELPRRRIHPRDFPTTFDRRTARYQTAIELARLILCHETPELRAGPDAFLGLLFNMERLFESFVAEMVRRAAKGSGYTRLQHQRPYWRSKDGLHHGYLRPDIVVRPAGGPITVIDTKWKLPHRGRPEPSDLHQMFLYNHYFRASRAVLVYPADGNRHPVLDGGYDEETHGCRTYYLELFRNEQFDPEYVREQLGALLAEG